MRALRTLLLTAAVLSFALAAAANTIPDIRIIFDPSPDPPVQLTDILSVGTPVPVSWQSCSNAGIPSSVSGETACLALANLTGQSIASLNLEFTVPASIAGQTVDCVNSDSFLTNNDCPTGALTTGQLVDITFSGGTPVPNDFDIFLGADAAGLTDPSQFPPVTIAATPEPGTLLLIPTGLLILGLGWEWRRHQAASA